MSEKFKVEIISPSETILKLDTSEVIIPSYEGEMGILKDHIALITFLRPGIIHIKNEPKIDYFIEEGIVEFANNTLLILTSTAKELSSIGSSSIKNLIIDAEKKINSDTITDKEKYLLSYKINTLKNISL